MDEFRYEIVHNTQGVIVNPARDNFFIAKSVILHIIEDIEENNEIPISISERKTFTNNHFLHKYLKGKKTLRMYSNLFGYLNYSSLYTPVIASDDAGGDKISFEDHSYSIYTKDDFILLFSDFELLKNESECRYYLNADALQLAKIVLEFDLEGIILKSIEGDFTLKRKSILKQFESILENYDLLENAPDFAFKIGGRQCSS